MPTFVQILDFIGTFAFAISGIRLASAKRFDWFGAYVVKIPPEIQAIVVEKPGLNVAGGAIGIGEITSIPTAPAIADAYYRLLVLNLLF